MAPNKEKLLKENSLKAPYARVLEKVSKTYLGQTLSDLERAALFEKAVLREGLRWDEDLAAATLGLEPGTGEDDKQDDKQKALGPAPH